MAITQTTKESTFYIVPPPKSPITQKKSKLFVTSNRYSPLHAANDIVLAEPTNQNNDEQNNINSNNNVIPLPPPIFVKGIQIYLDLIKELNNQIGSENYICKSSLNSLKLQTKTPDSYRKIIAFLKSENSTTHFK